MVGLNKIQRVMSTPKSNRTFSEGAKSKGILDDYAVRKNVNTQEGTIEKVPVNNTDIANKAYVDAAGGITDHSLLNNLDYASAGHTGFAPALGADDNYVTDAEKVVIGNTSGANTGDQASGDFDHNSLVNTHNLTTDIDHDQLTNFVGNEHLDWTADLGATNINPANYTDNDTTYVSSDFDHDQLTNFDANEHFLQSAISIPASQISDFDTEVSNNSSVTANTAKDTNVTTNLSAGTLTATTINVNSSDGTNATLVEADTTNAGILGSDKWDEIVANTAASHAESHTVVSHSDTTATGAELDTLTGGGDTTLHDHDGISENTSARHTQNTDTALGSGAVAADHGTAATDQIINVSYGTGSAPTANTTTIGSLFVKYTA